MIIQCKSCSKKFLVRDRDIPDKGRMVQCGYCSQKWFQTPVKTRTSLKSDIDKNASEMEFEASDGRTYKFLGSQWVEIYRSGKTGLLAKKKITIELNKLAGIVKPKKSQKRVRKIDEVEIENISRVIDPSSEEIESDKIKQKKQLPDVYRPKQGLGFFGYIFLIAIITLSIVGILKTFQNEMLMHFPKTEYIFKSFDNMVIIFKDLIKSEYIFETFDNILRILKDLIKPN